MRVPRIYLDAPLALGADITLPPQAAIHAVKVLRLGAGDAVVLFNGDAHDYRARLVEARDRLARARVESRQAGARESPLHITLAQAVTRGQKMDWIVREAVELGVAAIVPLVTHRSEVKLDGPRAVKRAAHWRAVGIAACEQSGRCTVPAIAVPEGLKSWVAALGPDRDVTRLVLHPGTGTAARALHPAPTVTLASGPEGGFDAHDLAVLRGRGFRELSLGPRTLRAETAGAAALAALQAFYGDL
jgi:16S rRNA (uracil1498-N3)-methyltransferase